MNYFYARLDNYPISNGHAETVPKKHLESFFDLNNNELTQMYKLINEVKQIINKDYKPDGYNIGINEGEAAGRTIHHLHIHLIPRYKGDVADPSGGIRNIIPDKGKY